jgi:RNA polymerase sigma-70 factor (ECF subfamily)
MNPSAPKLRLIPRASEPPESTQNSAENAEFLPRQQLAASKQTPPDPSLDDIELLTALRASDPTAATAFHDRAKPQIDRTILRLLGRRDNDHDDLAQLAMIEIIYAIEKFRGDCSLDSWISMLTARVVYKQLRRRKIERRTFGAIDPEMTTATSARKTERDAMAKMMMARVATHLEGMEEQKAWTFLLHDVRGYDLQEISEIMAVSVSAAQTRLVRGRREIHERIAADPELANCLEELEGGR